MADDMGFKDGSSRHHFIPEHFIKGFTADDGLLYRYDKERDVIEQRRYSPKQVFYETDGNTAHFGNKRHTMAERAYSAMDNMFAKHIEDIRNCSWDTNIHTTENHVVLLSLAADLYFRVPSNDDQYQKLYALSGVTALDKDGQEIPEATKLLEEGHTAFKGIRPFLPQNLISAIVERNRFPGHMTPRIAGFSYGVFVLSDNPVVLAKRPERLHEFLNGLILPISSTRFFVFYDQLGYGRDLSIPLNYNALAIEQAKKYVCSNSEVILSAAVRFWKDLRRSGYLPDKTEILFNDAFAAVSK